MADTINILQLNNGVPVESPVNGFLYIVINGVDHFISYEDLVKFVSYEMRAAGGVSANGGQNQVITFQKGGSNLPLPNANYALKIDDHGQGLGIELVSKTAEGFTINSIEAGNFDYIAISNT